MSRAGIIMAPASSKDTMTAREQQVLILVAEGRSDRFIATELGISLNTVQTHIKNARRKLGISHRGWARTPEEITILVIEP